MTLYNLLAPLNYQTTTVECGTLGIIGMVAFLTILLVCAILMYIHFTWDDEKNTDEQNPKNKEKTFCKQCGKKLSKDSTYCQYCGTKQE